MNKDKAIAQESLLSAVKPSKAIVSLAVPATLALLAKAVYNIVDTAYIGMLDSDIALAAVGVTLPLLLIMVSLENIFAAGAAVLAGRQLGAGDRDGANRTVTTIVSLSMLIGIVLCALADQIVSAYITDNMDDITKARMLYAYLTERVKYDHRYYSDKASMPYHSQTAYGALQDNLAICGGYSHALKLLLEKSGIECFNVSGRYLIPKVCAIEFLTTDTSLGVRRKSHRHQLFLSDFMNRNGIAR